MITRRGGLLLAGALTIAVAVLASPSMHPGDDGTVFAMAQAADIDRMEADLRADIAVFDLTEVAESAVPDSTGFDVAAIAGDGLTMTERLNLIEHGGRVKSARSLVASPASRFSART